MSTTNAVSRLAERDMSGEPREEAQDDRERRRAGGSLRLEPAPGQARKNDVPTTHPENGGGSGVREPCRRQPSSSQSAMSPAPGIRPVLTTLPSMTSPGVCMTP